MPTDRPGWSEPTLGFLVHDVARLLRKRLEQQARAAGIGLSRAQWQVLANIARCEGINQVGLAGILDIEPITLVRLLDRLEGMGFVERRLDPKDRRQRNLFLPTRHGQSWSACASSVRPCARRRWRVSTRASGTASFRSSAGSRPICSRS